MKNRLMALAVVPAALVTMLADCEPNCNGGGRPPKTQPPTTTVVETTIPAP